MMISPDTYYELDLKEKTSAQIMTEIRSLKQEIERLKDVMESPDYERYFKIEPNEHVQLYYTHKYLEKAKTALAESGGVYKPSKAELKAAAFNESIPAICKLFFSIGGYFEGYKTRTYTFDGENICVDIEYFPDFIQPLDDDLEQNRTVTRKEFLDGIRELNLGEWRTDYDPSRFGYVILDGTQWELEIYFSDNHKTVKIFGSNSYPYNFDEFTELLGIEPFK